MRNDFVALESKSTKGGVHCVVADRPICRSNRREDKRAFIGERSQFPQQFNYLFRERNEVLLSHFHALCRYPPKGSVEVELVPSRQAQFARAHKGHGEDLERVLRRDVSAVTIDRAKQFADTLRVCDCGVVAGRNRASAPRRSAAGSRSARPLAIAYRNTAPHSDRR